MYIITKASSVGASAGVSVYPLIERKGGRTFVTKSCFFRSFLEGPLDGSVFTLWATLWRFLENSEAPSLGHVGAQDVKKRFRKSIEIQVLLETLLFTIFCSILEHPGS